jgi:hypothetical protein
MSALRVELFFDEGAGNGHYRVPALHVNGGDTPTREAAERNCLSAITFAPGRRPSGLRHRRRDPHLRSQRRASSETATATAPAPIHKRPPSLPRHCHRQDRQPDSRADGGKWR